MAKRPPIDLIALTSEHAAPMPEATQRMAPASPPSSPTPTPQAKVKTENLEALAFKVPPAFRRRFRQRRSEEHTSELQSRLHLVCRLLLEKKTAQRGRPASPAPRTARGRRRRQ